MALEDTQGEVVTSAPAETPSSSPSEPSNQSGDSWRDEMRSILQRDNDNDDEGESGPIRDERGRFARSGDAGEDDEGDDASPGYDDDDVDEAPAIAKPHGVGGRVSDEDWSAAPDGVKQYIASREAEMQQYVSRQGERWNSVKPLVDTVSQNLDLIDTQVMQPHEAIGALLQAERMLRTNPREAIGWIAQAYGVDLGQLVGHQEFTDYGLPPDPQLTKLEQRIAQMQQHFERQEAQRTAEEQQRRQAAIEAHHQQVFERNHQGVSRVFEQYPVLETVAGDIEEQIPVIRRKNPEWNKGQVLKAAAERALRLNGKSVPWMQPNRQASPDAIERAKASKAANVKGQSGGAPRARSWRDEMRAIAAKSN